MDDATNVPILARRLDHLFRTVLHPQQGREYKYNEVSEAIAAAGGPAVSESYLYQMRIGRRDNPHLKLLEALAEFFGTDVAYFTVKDQVLPEDEELRRAALLRDDGVMAVAMRSSGVSRRNLHYVASILDQVRALEGLSDEAQPPLREWDVEPPGSTGD